MPDIRLTIHGDSSSGVRATNTLTAAIRETKVEAKQAAETSIVQARRVVEQTMKQRAEQVKLVASLREVATTAKRGSEEQVTATRLAVAEARKLVTAYGEVGAAAEVAGAKARASARTAAASSSEERGVLKGITGRGLGFASNAFLAGAVGGLAIKDIVEETQKAQLSQELLRNALKNSGISWTENRKEIERNLEEQEKLSGFDRVTLRQSLADISRGTHDLSKAQAELAIATDVARGRHMSLEAATKLVIRAQLGNVGALRRLGIEAKPVTTYVDQLREANVKITPELLKHAKALDLAATKTAVMAALQKRYAGASTAYTKTFAGQLDALRNTWRELEIQLGTAILPTLLKFTTWLAGVITKMRESKPFHDQLRAAFVGLKEVVKVTSDVFKALFDILGAASKVLGGTTHLVEALFLVMAVNKVRSIATSISESLIKAGIARIGPSAIAASTEYEGATGAMKLATVGLSATIKTALISTGIGALVVAASLAAVYIITHWDKVKKWIQEFGQWISNHAKILLAVPLIGPFLFAAGEVIKHWQTVKGWFVDFWGWLKKTALETVAVMVEPFSHLPGRMGAWARKAKDSIHDELWKMQGGAAKDAATQAANIFGQTLISGMAPWLRAANSNIANAMDPSKGAQAGAGGKPGSKAPGGSAGAGQGGKARLSMGQAQAVTQAQNAASQPGASTSYVFGGSGGDGYLGTLHTDCSGFVQRIMAANGVSIGRTTWQQYAHGTPVSWKDLQPGDLLFWNFPSDGGKPPQHVGMYIGGGVMVHDNHTGGGIVHADITDQYWRQHFFGARRYLQAAPAAGGGGSSAGGDPGADKPAVAKHTEKTAKADASAASFAAELAAADRKKKADAAKKKDPKISLASAAAVRTARDALTAEIGDAKDAGDGGMVKALQKIREHLVNGITSKDLAMIKVRMHEYGATIKEELGNAAKATKAHAAESKQNVADVAAAVKEAATRATEHAKAVVDAARSKFTDAWQRFGQEAMQAFDRVTQRELAAWQKRVSDHIADMRKDFQAQMKAFDKETQAGLAALAAPDQTPEEAALSAFQAARDATDRAANMVKLQTALAAAQASGDAEAVASAQADLDNALLDEQQRTLQAAAETSRKAANDAADAAQKDYQQQRDDLAAAMSDNEDVLETAYQTEQEALMQNYSDQRKIQQDELQNQLDDLAIHLADRSATWDEANQLLAGLMAAGGSDVGAAFVAGLKKQFADAGISWDDYKGALANAGTAATNQGASPDNRAGPRGINPTPAPTKATVKKTVAKATSTVYGGKHSTGNWVVPGADLGRDSVPTLLEPGEHVLTAKQYDALRQGGAGGGGPMIKLDVHGNVFTERELVQFIREAVQELGRRSNGNVFGGYA